MTIPLFKTGSGITGRKPFRGGPFVLFVCTETYLQFMWLVRVQLYGPERV
jgi:hypothetical protein